MGPHAMKCDGSFEGARQCQLTPKNFGLVIAHCLGFGPHIIESNLPQSVGWTFHGEALELFIQIIERERVGPPRVNA